MENPSPQKSQIDARITGIKIPAQAAQRESDLQSSAQVLAFSHSTFP
jgi:hypothetical protein